MQWEEQNREKTVGEERISSYLEALSSHAPVPSGGGASALSASLAFSPFDGGESHFGKSEVCLLRRKT